MNNVLRNYNLADARARHRRRQLQAAGWKFDRIVVRTTTTCCSRRTPTAPAEWPGMPWSAARRRYARGMRFRSHARRVSNADGSRLTHA
jgi:hypothetical protein